MRLAVLATIMSIVTTWLVRRWRHRANTRRGRSRGTGCGWSGTHRWTCGARGDWCSSGGGGDGLARPGGATSGRSRPVARQLRAGRCATDAAGLIAMTSHDSGRARHLPIRGDGRIPAVRNGSAGASPSRNRETLFRTSARACAASRPLSNTPSIPAQLRLAQYSRQGVDHLSIDQREHRGESNGLGTERRSRASRQYWPASGRIALRARAASRDERLGPQSRCDLLGAPLPGIGPDGTLWERRFPNQQTGRDRDLSAFIAGCTARRGGRSAIDDRPPPHGRVFSMDMDKLVSLCTPTWILIPVQRDLRRTERFLGLRPVGSGAEAQHQETPGGATW